MNIHPDLYLELSNIEKNKGTELERFYSKIKAIEKTESSLGAICIPETSKKLKELRGKNIDSFIIETLKKIEKIKYLHDFLTLSKEWPPFSFQINKVLSISAKYEEEMSKAPKGYVSKEILFDLITIFLLPFSKVYQKEVFKKDIDRCRVSIESETNQNVVWCEILMQAKVGFYKDKEISQIKADIEDIIRFHNHNKTRKISQRKIDHLYTSILNYICKGCYVAIEYDRRNGIPEKDIQAYFNKNFPFRKIVYERFLHKNPISKEELEESISSEEFYRTTECDDDAEYVYGGVFIPKKKPE